MGSQSSLYYNDNDPYCAQWVRNLWPEAEVDSRSVELVKPEDVAGYTRCHFFGGILGWEHALNLAGWGDAEVWTASLPCQPFSTAGKRKGTSDDRHLWPIFRDLVDQSRPPIIFGEQVASKAGREWLAAVRIDLEALGYAVGAADLCAGSVGAPHVRQRLFWGAANASMHGCQGLQRSSQAQVPKDRTPQALDAWHGTGNPFEHWSQFLAESYVQRVDDGVSSTVDIRPRLHAYGNAIVPQVAAQFISSFLEVIADLPTQV